MKQHNGRGRVMIGDLRWVDREQYVTDGVVTTVRVLQLRYMNKEGHLYDWQDVQVEREDT